MLLFMMLFSFAARPSTPLTDPERLRARVEAYINTIDTPQRPQDLQSFGEEGAALLEQFATDPHLLPSRRARAVEGLAVTGSSKAGPALQKLAQAVGEPFAVRFAAVRGLAVVAATPELLAALQSVLEADRDARLRAAAAETLARATPEDGCRAARAQLQRELPSDRAHFRRVVRLCVGSAQ